MRKINFVTGQRLAMLLPRVYSLYQSGKNWSQIGAITGYHDATVRGWVIEYEKYLDGKPCKHILRALPFLEDGKRPQQIKPQPKSHERQKPVEQARVQKQEKAKHISIMWGLVSIKF